MSNIFFFFCGDVCINLAYCKGLFFLIESFMLMDVLATLSLSKTVPFFGVNPLSATVYNGFDGLVLTLIELLMLLISFLSLGVSYDS